MLTITAVVAGASPAAAQQQPAPANGNWAPPPVTVARSTGSSNVAELVKCNVRVATDAGIWAGFDYCFPDPTSAKPWAAKLASTS